MSMIINPTIQVPTLCVHQPISSVAKLNYRYRNFLINGDFSIWQRGANFSVTPVATMTADRWQATMVGTVAKGLCIPGESELFGNAPAYLDITTTNVGGYIKQQIEDVHTLAGKQITLTLWSKGTNDAVMAVGLIQRFGTGGSPSAPVSTTVGNVTLYSAWRKSTLTVTVPSIAGKTLGTTGDSRLELVFYLPLGDIDLAHIQLEEGGVATDFEPTPETIQMLLCQRYYQMHRIDWRQYLSTAIAASSFNYPVIMRRVPTGSHTIQSILTSAGTDDTPNWTKNITPYADYAKLIFTRSAALADTYEFMSTITLDAEY